MIKLPSIPVDPSGESTRLVRSGLFSGVLLFAIFLAWGLTAPIRGAIVTSGIIKIDSDRKTIQHLEGGIIKQILVKEGSQVKKGQSLLILEDISTSSQFRILTDRLNIGKIKKARLKAQQKNAQKITFPAILVNSKSLDIQRIIANERSLFTSKRQNFIDQTKLLNLEATQIKSEAEGLDKEMEALVSGLGYQKKQLKASKALKKKGYIEESRLWELERNLAEKRERIGSLLARKAASESRVTDTKLKIISLKNHYRQEADNELKEVQRDLREAEELLKPAKYAFDRSAVVAPVAGQIINIQINTVGGIVKAGDSLMDLVPNQKELVIEGKLATSDIDSVHLDQVANIQLLAYSSRSTPMLTGKVAYISEDVIEDVANKGTYFYLCHIKVDEEELANLPKKTVLLPGMPITAFIQTREKTFIDFILEPIISHARKALREE